MFSHYYSTEIETCILKLMAYFNSLIDVTCYLLDSSKKMITKSSRKPHYNVLKEYKGG